MEQDEHAFKPQWLRQDAAKAAGTVSIFAAPSPRADNQGKGASPRNHTSGRDRHPSSRKSSGSNGSRRADRDGMGKSRGYANFGRNREKDREKDFDSRDRESRPIAPDRDGFQSFSTCKPERDRLNRARLKAETRNKGVVSLNNDSTSRSNADVSSSKSNDVVSSSESSTVVSTPVSIAAVSTSASNAAVSTSASNSAVSTSASSAGASTSGTSAGVNTSVSSAALSTSRSNAADASRSNAALSASKSNSALSTSRSNAALSTSRSNAALSTIRSNALSTPRNNAVVSTPRNNAAGMDFEREFPQLNLEDKNGKQGISRIPSPGISTPIQNVPLINASDGWNSVLADLPLLKDVKKILAASSALQTAPSKQTEAVSNSGTALSMAETVMQAPLRISIGPQLSIEAQKIEERTLRQYTLRPLTPPASKSSVLTSSKTKSARMGDPIGPSKTAQQFKMHSANGPVRAPVKIDISKLSQSGSFQVLNREQNGTVHTSRDCLSIPVSPPAPSVSMEPQKKPVVSQKFKIATHELSLPLQAPCGDRKSNARDKHRFFESLRTKSSNGSSTALETGCQQFPSSLVDVKQDSSLNHGNDQSVFPTGMKCMGNGKCSCEEENSSEGSQRHLSDNEDNSSSVKTDVVHAVSQELREDKKEADSSSEPADTGDEEFQLSLSDSAEDSSFSAPADSDDGFNRSQTGNEEGSLSSEATEPEDEYPAEPPPEDKPFLISLGWREDEVVQPLGLEEIADSVKGCAELEKKLWSMESNANVRIILLSILGGAK
ncbi:hypothetical protein EJB05_21186 [Eragrostis curvula]|uniref:Uncharacterized protein n=1 Tax=Eragrostis curvula TaxID=38414 RepID=A0A5J9V2M0_9POAL|nr:hypothetical protein EJB05_21186 [Eragrostis curvula]